jgi:hypothetical protein
MRLLIDAHASDETAWRRLCANGPPPTQGAVSIRVRAISADSKRLFVRQRELGADVVLNHRARWRQATTYSTCPDTAQANDQCRLYCSRRYNRSATQGRVSVQNGISLRLFTQSRRQPVWHYVSHDQTVTVENHRLASHSPEIQARSRLSQTERRRCCTHCLLGDTSDGERFDTMRRPLPFAICASRQSVSPRLNALLGGSVTQLHHLNPSGVRPTADNVRDTVLRSSS